MIALPEPALADDLVALRAWREPDVAQLVTACSDPLIQRYTSVPVPYERRDAELFVHAGRSVDALPLAVVDARDDAVVLGAVGLHAVDRESRRAEIGYWTAPWARRRGVAARGLVLLARWGVGDFGLERVDLYAEPANVASQGVAAAAGFTRGDLVRGGIVLHGRRRDVVRHTLFAVDR